VLTRQVEAGTGQGNQNDLAIHFGLGSHQGTVDLEVAWPDGKVEMIPGLATNKVHLLEQAK
jgi:hypothetical protein